MTAIRICPDMDVMCPFQTECNAKLCLKLYASPNDLTKPSSPVRTVTRKEIVPGDYGPNEALEVQFVEANSVVLGLVGDSYKAADIREFARLLTEIADAMEEKP